MMVASLGAGITVELLVAVVVFADAFEDAFEDDALLAEVLVDVCRC